MSRITDIETLVRERQLPNLAAVRWLVDRYRNLMEIADIRRQRILQYQQKLQVAQEAVAIMHDALNEITKSNYDIYAGLAQGALDEEQKRKGV